MFSARTGILLNLALVGGGVIIATRRHLRAAFSPLHDTNSLLDQLCVKLHGATGVLYICVSYIPPGSSDYLYKAHVDNILALHAKIGDSQLCVLGDFNLSNISWSYLDNNNYLTPSNVNSVVESYFIDNLLCIELSQVNGFLNKLNRILDLVFVSFNINFKLSHATSHISPPNQHHTPLVLEIEFLNF